MSGQKPIVDVRVGESPFDLNALYAACREENETGAVVFFVGQVRAAEPDQSADAPRQSAEEKTRQLKAMQIEHYAGMTESVIESICEQAAERWSIKRCVVRHRVGTLNVGEPIVLVMVASSHRQSAYDASEFIMDFLKTEAPFWKKAVFHDGAQWVATKQSDSERRARW